MSKADERPTNLDTWGRELWAGATNALSFADAGGDTKALALWIRRELRLLSRLTAAERELKTIKEEVVEYVLDGTPFNWTEAVIIIREERAKAAKVREAARRRVAANLQAAVRDKWPDPDGIQHRVGMACARFVADGTDLLAGPE
jgi:hypothetical protein